MAKDARQYTADELIGMLRAKYPLPQFAFIPQVPNGTGDNKNRTADGIAIGCWRSVGIQMHGFEVKVSRSDWIKEIQDLSKSAVFQKHCHYWWIVAAPGIVKLEEMPAEWGLMEPIESGVLKIRKAGSALSPDPITFQFLAAILRRACSDSPLESLIRSTRDKAYIEGKRVAEDNFARNEISAEKRFSELLEIVSRFEKDSGVRIRGYGSGDIGKEIAAFKRMQRNCNFAFQIEQLREAAKHLLEDADLIEQHSALLPKLEESA